MTTNISPEDFFGPAIAITNEDISRAAEERDIEPGVVLALVNKESRSKGFLEDGRPVILYEMHKFNSFTKGKYLAKYPELATKTQRQNKYGPSGAWQYQKLEKAMALDETAALKSCSWGKFQIMGFNFKECGYSSVQDMVLAFVASEQNQLEAFMRFLDSKKLIGAMQRKDWAAIAEGYNGANYRINNYDTDLEKKYNELSSNIVRKGARGTLVVTLQKLLNQQGFKINVDGVAGQETIDAVKAFQYKHQLTADGVAGPATFAKLAAAKVEVIEKPVAKTNQGKAAIAAAGVGVPGAATFVGQAINNAQNSGPDIQKAANAVTKAANSTSDVVQQKAVQDVVSNVAELSIQVQYQTYIIIGLFLLLILMAGFIVWSKMEENKRLKGV